MDAIWLNPLSVSHHHAQFSLPRCSMSPASLSRDSDRCTVLRAYPVASMISWVITAPSNIARSTFHLVSHCFAVSAMSAPDTIPASTQGIS